MRETEEIWVTGDLGMYWVGEGETKMCGSPWSALKPEVRRFLQHIRHYEATKG